MICWLASERAGGRSSSRTRCEQLAASGQRKWAAKTTCVTSSSNLCSRLWGCRLIGSRPSQAKPNRQHQADLMSGLSRLADRGQSSWGESIIWRWWRHLAAPDPTQLKAGRVRRSFEVSASERALAAPPTRQKFRPHRPTKAAQLGPLRGKQRDISNFVRSSCHGGKDSQRRRCARTLREREEAPQRV